MHRGPVIALLVAFIVLTAACGSDGGRSLQTVRTSWDGRVRTATLGVPDRISKTTPIVLVLHLLDPAGNQKILAKDLAETLREQGSISAAPRGVGISWNAGVCCATAVERHIDDVGYLRDLIARLQGRFGDRPVYVVGYSNGGFMALRLACEGVPLAGIITVEAVIGVPTCAPRPMDYLAVHQTGDEVVPYAGTPHAVAGSGRPFIGVDESFARWREAARCATAPRRRTTRRTTTSTYRCADGTEATLLTIVGGSHMWPQPPRSPIDAASLIIRTIQRWGQATER